MKHIVRVLFLFILFTIMPNVQALDKVNVYLFHSTTCSHCQAEIEYLNSRNDVNVYLYEVTEFNDVSKKNLEFMNDVRSKLDIKTVETPLTIIGTTYYNGFGKDVKKSIDSLIEYELETPSVDVVNKILNGEDVSGIKIQRGEVRTLTILGHEIDLMNLSLPIVSIIVGFIDGFNPCAMWILLFLISMIVGMKNRRKMWTIGLTFLITSAIVYMAFMLAWLKIATTLIHISWVQIIIALIALIGGCINLISYYDELKKDDGCHVVDSKKRRSILLRIRNIVAKASEDKNSFWQSEGSFVLALIGVVGLAISVNLIELACSSSLPLIFTQVLALNHLSKIQYLLYILLYIIFFLIDDIVIFAIAMRTLKVTGISTKYNKLSHLIGGIVMIIIGLLMLFKPAWLMFNF